MKYKRQELYKFMGLSCKDYKLMLDFLIENEEDMRRFLSGFYIESSPVRSILRYRDYKRKESMLSEGEFREMYLANRKKALETLFQEPLALYGDSVLKTSISYKDIYSSLVDDPKITMNEAVRGSYTPVEFDDSFLIL